jgi:predicted DNA-binding transcriptional regulator YafY
MEEASVRALSKLRQVLPSRLRRRVTALHSFIVPLGHRGPTVDAEMLTVLAGACRDSEKLQFRYKSRDGAASTREVEPHRLVHTGMRWYLAAWDLDRNNWRTFRVDRMESRITTGQRFSPRKPPKGGFAAYVARSVSYAPYAYQARITLYASLEMATERIPPGVGTLAAIDENTCELRTGASSLDTLSVHLALIGFDFKVHEPPELIERIHWLAQRFNRATALD